MNEIPFICGLTCEMENKDMKLINQVLIIFKYLTVISSVYICNLITIKTLK